MTERAQNTVWLAEQVMGWKVHKDSSGSDHWIYLNPPRLNDVLYLTGGALPRWNPYLSIADAWMLVERIRKIIPKQTQTQTFSFQLCQTGIPGEWMCSFTVNDGDWSAQATVNAATAAEAICEAALKTLEGK